MNTRVTSIEGKLKEKEPKCDYCGRPEHSTKYACPRIDSVQHDRDGDIVHFKKKFKLRGNSSR